MRSLPKVTATAVHDSFSLHSPISFLSITVYTSLVSSRPSPIQSPLSSFLLPVRTFSFLPHFPTFFHPPWRCSWPSQPSFPCSPCSTQLRQATAPLEALHHYLYHARSTQTCGYRFTPSLCDQSRQAAAGQLLYKLMYDWLKSR